MALIVADRIKETSTTTGTGAFTLAGAITGFRAFSTVCTSPSDTCYYAIQAFDGSGVPTGDWEVGLGTYSAANTLTRTTVLSSSNAGSAVNFAAGTKQVWIDLAAAQASSLAVQCIPVAVSDETTALTVGTGKVTFRMPYAFTLLAVRASLTTAQATGNIFTVAINEAGVSILSTALTIDNTEKSSTTAVAPPVISDPSLADDAEITIDISQIGDGTAKGLKVYLIGTKA